MTSPPPRSFPAPPRRDSRLLALALVTGWLLSWLVADPAGAWTRRIEHDVVLPASDVWIVMHSDTLIVAEGATLIVEGVLRVHGHLQVDGTLDAAAPAYVEIRSSGTAEISGSATIGVAGNYGVLSNQGSVDFVESFTNVGRFEGSGETISKGDLWNSGVLLNTGSFHNQGELENVTDASFENEGLTTNAGTFENAGTTVNRAATTGPGPLRALFLNSGIFENGSDALLQSVGSDFVSQGQIDNAGEILNELGAELRNETGGELVNQHYASIDNDGGTIANAGGVFLHSGTLTNRPGSLFENLSSASPLPVPEFKSWGGSVFVNEGVLWNESRWEGHGHVANGGGFLHNLCDGEFRALGSFDNRGPGRVLNSGGSVTYTTWLGPLPVDSPICLR
ncbi:MAG: hypothetical protein QNK04_28590 [Myxococcota bacterium]|nr:hypothetical protein [Myxococcota bacterium]